MTKRGVLAGIRVLDLTRMLSGPYCTMVLADHGAEVIKIEDNLGDTSRHSGPFESYDIEKKWSGYFISLNRNKKSVQIDLKSKKGKLKFLDLVSTADVVVENFRPGVMERLDLSYERLSELNPKLVYGAIRGFGDPRSGKSPYHNWPSYDVVAQAMGGVINLTGSDPNNVTKVGPGVGDIFTGLFMTFGLIAAIREVDSSGLGQFIDIAMYDAMISLCERAIYQYDIEGKIPTATGNSHPFLAPFGIFPAKDGKVAIAVVEDRFWKRLVKEIGLMELSAHSDYATIESRRKNLTKVNDFVASWTKKYSKSELLEKLGGKVPYGPVNDVAEIFNDPHTLSRNMVEKIKNPERTDGYWSVAANPLNFSRFKRLELATPPKLGQHNELYLKPNKTSEEYKLAVEKLREAFGSFTTGVTIVTTLQSDGIPRGFTANSFSSVSLDPPLLLVCLSKTALSYNIFTNSTYFAINVLSQKQKHISALFSTQSKEKFNSTNWEYGYNEMPLLTESLSTFVCSKEKLVDAGDHSILIGRIDDFSMNEGKPLLYYKGQYVSPKHDE